MSYKSAFLFVLAVAFSLGGCVNDSKNTMQSVPLDTTYLHSFSKVSIGLYGAFNKTQKVSYGTFTLIDTSWILPLHQYGYRFTIRWAGNSFFADSSRKYHFGPSGLPGREDETDESLLSSLRATISKENSVEGVYIYSEKRFGQHGSLVYTNDDHDFNFHFTSVPLFISNSDTLSFRIKGSPLKNNILSLWSTYTDRITSKGSSDLRDTLKTIIWDSALAPELTITFYK